MAAGYDLLYLTFMSSKEGGEISEYLIDWKVIGVTSSLISIQLDFSNPIYISQWD